MTSLTAPPPSVRAGAREWTGLAVLALPTLLLSLDVSVLYLALPSLSADLAPSSSQQLWILDIYGFMIAGLLVTMGTLGDRIGRRRLLLIGAAAFGVASVLAAYSASAEMLILTRAVLGIAGATLMPSSLALISNMFQDARQRALAIAVWMSTFMAGAAIGPLAGGALLETFWWGAAFLIGVPVMILLLVTGPLVLPEYRDEQAGRLDPTSVVLSLVALLPFIYGLKDLAQDGMSPTSVLALVAGTAFGVAFVRRQRTLADPLLDVRLFANRSFSSALAILLLGMAATGGVYLFVTLYLQQVEGLSPFKAGLWLLPSALALIAGSLLSPLLARRFPPGLVVSGGLLVSAVGCLAITQADSLPVLMIAFVIASVGTGPMGALAIELIIGSAPPEKAGSASAISETSGEFGIALGVATLGSLGTAVYRHQVNVPEGTPAEPAHAARDSISGATDAAAQLPAPLAGELLSEARDAFTDGLVVIAGASAAFSIGLAILAVVLLRHVRPGNETS